MERQFNHRYRVAVLPALGVVAALVLLSSCRRSDAGSPSAAASDPLMTQASPHAASTNPSASMKPVNPADLTPIQHAVTKKNGTEPAFRNEYWNHYDEGIYVSIVTGKPLFTSLDKYDSGCGWPSFVKPIDDGEVKNLPDTSHGMVRTEVRTADDESHLGHVFEDGPQDRGGLRYCINSAALRFVPKDKMAEAGYGHLLSIFEKSSTAP